MVELTSLGKDEFVRILTEPKNALTVQYQKLLGVDNIELAFDKSGIERIAEIAVELNTSEEDIGARRLQGILENLIEEISFDVDGDAKKTVLVNKEFVDKNLSQTTKNLNLSKFIL